MNEMNEQNTVLHARNVHKAYGSRGSSQHVLKGINLRVLRKEFVGIMGPSGSGKSTLIDETLKRFQGVPAWLRNAQPSEEELEGYIVSTVASIDAPHKVRDLICRQDIEYFSKRPKDARLVARADALEASKSAFEELARATELALDEQAVCVFGGRDIIARQNAQLEVIDLLGI